jgi:phospholipase/carboxylesterase
MGIFGNQIPAQYLVLSPRGLFESDLGGYSWLRRTVRSWPGVEDFDEPSGQILALADAAAEMFKRDLDGFHLIGFSQGAALVYALAFRHPDRVLSLASLAGFMPDGAQNLVQASLLSGLRAFVSHGTQDQTIPVEQARYAVNVLEQAGAEVVYCEADVGHKLGAACFRALGKFYQGLSQ